MSDDIVGAAPPSGGVKWEDHNGKLLIIEPLGHETGINTSNGVKDAVRANLYVLTGPETAEEFDDALIFPKVMQGQTRREVGKKVVGRLGQGNAKPGQNPPWVILEATPDDLAKARHYLAHRQPAVTSAAPPQQDAWGAPDPAPAAQGSAPPF
jgi:hypothetical protein